MTERERLLDQVALIDALTRHVVASSAKQVAETELVRLARRLTESWRLSDAEAVEVAGRDALSSVARVGSASPKEQGKGAAA